MTLYSPLHHQHADLGARLVDFAGWAMPLQFSGVLAEHTAVRERVGLFDVSHLGKLLVAGPDAARLLDQVLSNNTTSLAPGRARYNLALTDSGGIIDDLFVYHRVEDGRDVYLVVPNAANAEAVLTAIRDEAARGAYDAGVIDARERWAILALQGPASRIMAQALLPEALDLRLHAFTDVDLAGVPVQVARTGYTGEYGFELFVPWVQAPRIWQRLLDAGRPHGILPIGLGARDTLRLEMGYPLHGHEISVDTNPLEAGLGWAVDFAKPAFVGREALESVRAAGGPTRRLVGLTTLGTGIPRADQAILQDATPVGMTTSGNFSVLLGKGIALGYVRPDLVQPGTVLEVDVRGRRVPVAVTKPPFVPRGRAAPAIA